MVGLIGGAMLAGLMGSPHCLGMCGGFATACARPRGGLIYWHGGRLTTYGLLGAAGGGFGAALPGPGWVAGAVASVLLLWFAAGLAGLVPERGLRLPWLARAGRALVLREGRGWRYAFGVATGLLPCGMVYAALSLAVATAHPAYGALAMVAFGLGTLPALSLLSLGVRRLAARSLWHRRALAFLVLVAGLCSVAARGALTAPEPGATHTPAAHGAHH